ncbi:COX15/CtaA family protein [Flavisolibacter ginsenosidimutans]|uniref:COX15/CtaA family protein n=1 Tax=Flavisolibacter ginsenosidimutans TaxID=661481 RepID=UPI00155AD677|nr:COX15/CtaA family protein [Flavisolibacter ginsenosidimutans]
MLEEIVSKRSRPVAIWLLVGVFMIIVQIILGGITRLTDSGLSITEWQPLLGAVPPTNEAEWNKAFEGYKHIAQFKHLHAYFTLDDFKSIFFWEWLHRLWGRFIGVVFIIPFVIFLVQKRFTKDMITPMLILFLLGGLQGLIGWVMVMSGLNDENLYVSHIRLAIHFITALGLLVYTFWFALRLLVQNKQKIAAPSSKNLLGWILGLLVVQLIYGAFMAGLKAALAAPTWPSINGYYLPPYIAVYQGKEGTFFSALVNNPVTVHFIHRNIAYLLTILIAVWTVKAAKEKRSALFNRLKWIPLLLVLTQVGLGIAAVLTSIKKQPQQWGLFEWNAQLHQVVAMLLLLSLTAVFFLHKQNKSAAA